MAQLWNVNNSYINSNKRISGKLGFNIGEKLTGRIIGKNEANMLVIRLMNGWEIEGELTEGEFLKDLEGNLARFEIEGFENGKLKLKLLSGTKENTNTQKPVIEGDLSEILMKEGLDIEDVPLLNKMLKFNIPLNRENISEVKSLVDFHNKIIENPEEGEVFITKYFEAKNINETPEAKKIVNEFLKEFKNLTTDEILTFIENDIDFNKENILGFKRVFKGNNESISTVINDFNKPKEFNELNEPNIKPAIEVPKETIPKGEVKEIVDKADLKNTIKDSGKIPTDIYTKNEVVENKVQIMDILKSISKSDKENINIPIENNEQQLNNTEPKVIVSDKNIKEITKEFISSIKDNTLIEKIVTELEKQQLPVTKENVKELVKLINKEIAEQDKNYIKEAISTKTNESKEIIKNIISQMENNEEIPPKLLDIIKSNITEIKLFNKVSNEYYYFDMPINVRDNEYPCKLIVKDNRKEGKKIDSSNVKMIVTVDTKNIGVVDSYITVKNKLMEIELKCNKEFCKIISLGVDKLKDIIESLGYNVNINVKGKADEVDIVNCREFFNENNITNIDIKV